MRNRLLAGAALALLLAGPVTAVAQAQAPDAVAEANPLLSPSPAPDGTPPYDRIRPEHYEPAFDAAIAAAHEDFRRIAENPEPPTFANTLEEIERAGRPLARVSSTFFNVA